MGPYWRQRAQLRGYFCNLAERWLWPKLSWWQPGWKEKKDSGRYLRGRPETVCRLSFPFLRQSFPSPLGQLGTPIPSGLLSPLPPNLPLPRVPVSRLHLVVTALPRLVLCISTADTADHVLTLICSSLGFQEATLLFLHLPH